MQKAEISILEKNMTGDYWSAHAFLITKFNDFLTVMS